MYSHRFERDIVITHHALQRMHQRHISESLIEEIIDTGEIRYKDSTRLWVYKYYPDRNDNLLCAVLVPEKVVVIKTVMHHFEVL